MTLKSKSEEGCVREEVTTRKNMAKMWNMMKKDMMSKKKKVPRISVI